MIRLALGVFAAVLAIVPAAAQAPKKVDPRQVVEAQKTLERFGCKLHFDEVAPGAPVDLVWFPRKTNNTELARLVGHAARLPQLKMIDLGETDVRDAGLKELARLPHLESVYLDDTAVTDEGVKSLVNVGRLAWLDLTGTKVTAKSTETLVGCKALHHLFLGKVDLGAAEVQQIGSLGKLRSLGVGSLPDASIADLARLPDLKEVRLAKVGKTTGEELAKLKGLEVLQLRGGFGSLSADGWKGLASLPDVKSLTVGNFGQDETSFRRAWDRKRKPAGFPISAAVLGEMRGLKKLDLTGLPIGDDALKTVGKLAGLEELCLCCTLVTLENCAADLAGLGKLQFLNARSTNINDRGLKSMEGLKELRFLWLFDTAVTDAGVNRLQKALPRCTIYWKYGKGSDHQFRIPGGYGK